MRRAPLRLLLALAAGTMLAACNGKAAERAIWTWEAPSYAMLESTAVADEALAFLKRRHVTVVYLYADAYQGRNLIADNPHAYRDFIARAHAQGIKVYALLGSAYLETERYTLPEHRAEALAMLQRVLDYNAKATAAQRFDGVNYDIEPHLLDAWSDASRETLLRDYLDLAAALMAAKRKSGDALQIGPAMPFWWDGVVLDWHGTRKPVSDHLIDLSDYVALMDYRNRAEGRDGIIAHADAELAYARRVRKRVVIGVELIHGEPAKISFHGKSEAELERELGKVETAYADSPAFAGFALHHYAGYRAFVGEPAPKP